MHAAYERKIATQPQSQTPCPQIYKTFPHCYGPTQSKCDKLQTCTSSHRALPRESQLKISSKDHTALSHIYMSLCKVEEKPYRQQLKGCSYLAWLVEPLPRLPWLHPLLIQGSCRHCYKLKLSVSVCTRALEYSRVRVHTKIPSKIFAGPNLESPPRSAIF